MTTKSPSNYLDLQNYKQYLQNSGRKVGLGFTERYSFIFNQKLLNQP